VSPKVKPVLQVSVIKSWLVSLSDDQTLLRFSVTFHSIDQRRYVGDLYLLWVPVRLSNERQSPGFDCCCGLDARGVAFGIVPGATESGRCVASTAELEALLLMTSGNPKKFNMSCKLISILVIGFHGSEGWLQKR
jgi:hypothetical protein